MNSGESVPFAKNDTYSHGIYDDLVDLATRKIRADESIPWETWAQRYPEHIEKLRTLVSSIQLLKTYDSQPEAQASSLSTNGHDGAPSRVELDFEWQPGIDVKTHLLGDFLIQREIGRGGMGVVYEALQLSLGRRVALKVLRSASLRDPKYLARFRNEARAAALLEHPHIVPIYSVGEFHDVHYYAMRLIPGRSLADWTSSETAQQMKTPDSSSLTITSIPTRDGGPTVVATPRFLVVTKPGDSVNKPNRERIRIVAELVRQVADALDHAHQQNVIHRDVKPSNLLLSTDGHIWVADFGLALVEGSEHLSVAGEIMGTLRYMSPEQVQAGTIDRRTDIYSLGVTLYELVTHTPAIPGSGRAEILRGILEVQPNAPRQINREIPVDLETIILKAMAKNPADRYATAGEFAEDLDRFLSNRTILAQRPTWLDRLAKWSHRHRAFVTASAMGLGVMTMALLLVVLLIWQQNRKIAETLATAQFQSQEANFQSARLAMWRGQAMCGEGDVGRGLTWMVHALELCPTGEHDFQRVIRANVGGWLGRVHALDLAWELPALTALACAPNSRLLTCGKGNEVCVWNTETGDVLQRLAIGEPEAQWEALTVHPDREIAAAGSVSGKIAIFEIESGRLIVPPLDEGSFITQLQFSPDGRHLLSVSNNVVRLWSVVDGQALGSPCMHPGPVTAVTFDVDGQSFLTSNFAESRVNRWSIPDCQALGIAFESRDGPVRDWAWVGDGRQLALGCAHSFSGCFWNREDGTFADSKLQHFADFTDLDADHNGRLLVTASFDRTARIWTCPAGTQCGAPLEHPESVVSVAIDPQGTRVVTTSGNPGRFEIRCWKVQDEHPRLPQLPDVGFEGRFFVDSQGQVYCAGTDHQMYCWNSHAEETAKPIQDSTDAFGLSPDGRTAIWVSKDEIVGYRLDERRRIWQVPFQGSPDLYASKNIKFNASGTRAVIAGTPTRYLDAATGELVCELDERGSRGIRVAAFSPNDQLLATGGQDKSVQFWNVHTHEQIGEPLVLSDEICDLLFSADGETLYAGTVDGKIWSWDAQSHNQKRPPIQLPAPYKEMAFHPQGALALAVAGDATATFFEMRTGWAVGPAIEHHAVVRAPGYSADGKAVYTCGPHNSVRSWRVPTPREEDLESLRLQVEVSTGLTLNANEGVTVMTAQEWRERQTKLATRGATSPSNGNLVSTVFGH